MAYVSNNQNEEEQKNAAQGPVSPGAAGGTSLSPSAGIGSAGSSPTSGTPAQQGGGFASLNQYVSANQGNAQPLADKITSGINNQFNTLQGQNQQTLQGIQGQVDKGYTKQNQAILDQANTNPVSFASDANNVSAFQGQLNDKYTGPGSAESVGDYQNQLANVNNAIATGKNVVGTEAGRQGLLKGVEKAPNNAVTGLNSAILSQDTNASNQVQNAYSPFSNLVSGLQTGAQGINTQIGQAQNEAKSASDAANKVISDQMGGLNTAVQGQLSNAQTKNSDFIRDYNNIVSGLSYGNVLNTNQVQQLGMTQQQYDSLRDQQLRAATSQAMTAPNFGVQSKTSQIDENAYLKQLEAPGEVNANQVATPEQFQQLQALFQLNNGQMPGESLISPAFASQANSYVAPTLNGAFDYDAALKGNTGLADQERQDALQQAQGMSSAAQAEHDAGKKNKLGKFIQSPIGSIAKYITNPILSVPQEISKAKQISGKI